MKRFLVIIFTIIMLLVVGCQGKEANTKSNLDSTPKQEKTVNANGETKSSSSSGTQNATEGQTSNTSDTTKNTENKSSTTTDKKVSTGKTASQTKTETPKAENSTFTLLITRNRGSEELFKKELALEQNKTLMDYLRDNIEVTDEGGFIKDMKGYASVSSKDLSSEQKSSGIMGVDWFIFINNTKAKSGAGDIMPAKEDIIQLDYREWTYKDLAP